MIKWKCKILSVINSYEIKQNMSKKAKTLALSSHTNKFYIFRFIYMHRFCSKKHVIKNVNSNSQYCEHCKLNLKYKYNSKKTYTTSDEDISSLPSSQLHQILY